MKHVFKTISRVLELGVILTAIRYLINKKDDWLNFLVRDTVMDDRVHGYAFSTVAGKVEEVFATSAVVVLVFAIAMLLCSWFWSEYDDEFSWRLHTLGMVFAIDTGIMYLILNLIVGHTKVELDLKFALYMALLVIGAILVLVNVIRHKKSELYNVKKTTIIAGSIIMGIIAVVSIVYPVVKLYDDCKRVDGYRDLVKEQRIGYDEEIEYQVGNYCRESWIAENSVYVEERLYLVDSMQIKDKDGNDLYNDRIYAVDADGNYELVYAAENDTADIKTISYYEGYIYANAFFRDSEQNCIIRISIDKKTVETVFVVDGAFTYGIADGKLFYYIEHEDIGGNGDEIYRDEVYYIDLAKENSFDDPVLYDDGVFREYARGWVWFSKYVYNQAVDFYYPVSFAYKEVCPYQGSIYQLEEIPNPEHYAYTYVALKKYSYNEDKVLGYDETIIDTHVYSYNIFASQIYYVKYMNDAEEYQIWTCDMDGDNKSMFTAIPAAEIKKGRDDISCRKLHMGEYFMILDFGNGNVKSCERYILWLENGRIEQVN
ncbi:MAG: hypothetical protein J6A25_11970 [Lachnospiraceae bacterium]|nr:hypothetical protein [Lachnospiraceae bacterium]